MKRFSIIAIMGLFPLFLHAQFYVHGTVKDKLTGKPLSDVNVRLSINQQLKITDNAGGFTLYCATQQDTISIRYLGYRALQQVIHLEENVPLYFELEPIAATLEQVEISTGYYKLPAERATGSFVQIDSSLLNRTIATDVISRLEGVTNGLLFDRRTLGTNTQEPKLMIRGESTIHANSDPLIVVDNFPFEGDLNSINPNDVASITVLKDAAAASIWGARAGNGVIVVTTKTAKYNQKTKIGFTANITSAGKPDLKYSKNYIPSADFLEMERIRFADKAYAENDWTPLTPAIELLIKERDGELSAEEVNKTFATWASLDSRDELAEYFYRPLFNQQYALNMQGGADVIKYYLAAGYDNNLSSQVGNAYKRFTLNANTSYRLLPKLELSIGLGYTNELSKSNALPESAIAPNGKGKLYPYAQLRDENGSSLAIAKDYRASYTDGAVASGLLDWSFRPLDELALTDNKASGNEMRMQGALDYEFLPGLHVNLKYQFQQQEDHTTELKSADSYTVRDMVNRFTQQDGEQIFPYGDIFTSRTRSLKAHNFRAQFNLDKTIGEEHFIDALAGFELRERRSENDGYGFYGYDPEVLTFNNTLDYLTYYQTRPRGSSRISDPSIAKSILIDHYVSYFANAAYKYRQYTLTGSVRWDASNLFGVATNQKGVPLWSIGAAWDLSDMPFYSLKGLSYFRLKATYGYNGNTNSNASALVTAFYTTDGMTGLPMAQLRSPGNPLLRWEKTNVINIGADFGAFNNRISGSVEYYWKRGTDLLGNAITDITTGWNSRSTALLMNNASLLTRGLDITLNTLNTSGKVAWRTTFLFNYNRDKVLHYENSSTNIASFTSGLGIPAVEGKSLNTIFSYPFFGLDGNTGDPLVRQNDAYTTNYSAYLGALTMDDLIEHGLSSPPLFGSVRNSLSYKGWSLSANILWKADYYFRRNSINYGQLFNRWEMQEDFIYRWKQPGDEESTNVPSIPSKINAARDNFYNATEILVEKADHVRLQDINLSYVWHQPKWLGSALQEMRFTAYASNLGIIWQASKTGIDPDIPKMDIRNPKTFAFGVTATF